MHCSNMVLRNWSSILLPDGWVIDWLLRKIRERNSPASKETPTNFFCYSSSWTYPGNASTPKAIWWAVCSSRLGVACCLCPSLDEKDPSNPTSENLFWGPSMSCMPIQTHCRCFSSMGLSCNQNRREALNFQRVAADQYPLPPTAILLHMHNYCPR